MGRVGEKGSAVSAGKGQSHRKSGKRKSKKVLGEGDDKGRESDAFGSGDSWLAQQMSGMSWGEGLAAVEAEAVVVEAPPPAAPRHRSSKTRKKVRVPVATAAKKTEAELTQEYLSSLEPAAPREMGHYVFPRQQKAWLYVQDPRSTPRLYWDAFLLLCIVWIMLVTPFQIAFVSDAGPGKVFRLGSPPGYNKYIALFLLNTVVDLALLVDIFCVFNRADLDSSTTLQCDVFRTVSAMGCV